jgi:hypothetical protein
MDRLSTLNILSHICVCAEVNTFENAGWLASNGYDQPHKQMWLFVDRTYEELARGPLRSLPRFVLYRENDNLMGAYVGKASSMFDRC